MVPAAASGCPGRAVGPAWNGPSLQPGAPNEHGNVTGHSILNPHLGYVEGKQTLFLLAHVQRA